MDIARHVVGCQSINKMRVRIAFDDAAGNMCAALIDGEILLSLTEVDMRQDLGVARLAERRRLCDAIRYLARHAKHAQVRSIVDNITRKVGPGPGGGLNPRPPRFRWPVFLS